ncbi:MAG: hypothetical protein LBI29_03635 [Rickettsiales bacterium]|jgi:hypothetical protein|nr:hypothetical protein [Rickettsiales bacterium]
MGSFPLVFVLAVVACANVNFIHLTKELRTGDTREEVVSAMGGNPAEQKASVRMDVLVYYLHASIFDLVFSQKRAPFVGFYPLLLTGREFWIVVDRGRDRTVAFGYAEDFNNSLKDLDKL